jgi:hypothetical protein
MSARKQNAANLDGVHGAGTALRKTKPFNHNSNAAHRLRISEYLLAHGALDTETARMELDAYHPPARIRELRVRFGWQIETVFVDRTTASCGEVHRIGKYILVKAPKAEEVQHHG